MSDNTSIEWTTTTWNPTTGCDKVSPGCGLPRPGSDDERTGQTGGCYAMTMARRLKAMGQAKYQNDGNPATSGPGFGVTMHPDALTAPLGWTKPRKVFVNSMSDLFHDKVDASFIAQVFAVMSLADQHIFQVLTKRHARMRSLLSSDDFPAVVNDYRLQFRPSSGELTWPIPGVWLGVSAEDQKWADIRVPALLNTPAAIRFISAEPLLGPIHIDGYLRSDVFRCRCGAWEKHGLTFSACAECGRDWAHEPGEARIDWLIAGGESGPGARPLHPAWVRDLRDQCTAAETKFFFKQWGAWALGAGHPEGEEGPGDTFINPDGVTGHVWFNEDLGYPTNYAGPWGEDSQIVYRVGKKHAGRELDGRVWNEFPDVRAAVA